MFKVIEAFSGIGSQAKALKRASIKHKVIATVDWDIHAIYAYDIIHNGKQNLEQYNLLTKDDCIKKLSKYTLSSDGKSPLTIKSLALLSEIALKKVLCAIERTNNLVSITDVKAKQLPDDIDLFTYSFPCQDLSVAAYMHSNFSGIDRNANNRSGMLWEVERILKEYVEIDKKLPKFLLMENVSSLLSPRHINNFNIWKNFLSELGYINQVYTLDASNFGIPQKRIRTYMLSVLCDNEHKKQSVKDYFECNNLEQHKQNKRNLKEFLFLDYTKTNYRDEAERSTPNYTPSREKIYNDNIIAYNGVNFCEFVNTITTKQDRNPTSAVIDYKSIKKKSIYRNLTPRECFVLMGFDEMDYQQLVDNNFYMCAGKYFLPQSTMIKLAGNSIVVNVLEKIFKQMKDISKILK